MKVKYCTIFGVFVDIGLKYHGVQVPVSAEV